MSDVDDTQPSEREIRSEKPRKRRKTVVALTVIGALVVTAAAG